MDETLTPKQKEIVKKIYFEGKTIRATQEEMDKRLNLNIGLSR